MNLAHIAYQKIRREKYNNFNVVKVCDIYDDKDSEECISPATEKDFKSDKKYWVRFCDCGEEDCRRDCESSYDYPCYILHLSATMEEMLPKLNKRPRVPHAKLRQRTSDESDKNIKGKKATNKKKRLQKKYNNNKGDEERLKKYKMLNFLDEKTKLASDDDSEAGSIDQPVVEDSQSNESNHLEVEAEAPETFQRSGAKRRLNYISDSSDSDHGNSKRAKVLQNQHTLNTKAGNLKNIPDAITIPESIENNTNQSRDVMGNAPQETEDVIQTSATIHNQNLQGNSTLLEYLVN